MKNCESAAKVAMPFQKNDEKTAYLLYSRDDRVFFLLDLISGETISYGFKNPRIAQAWADERNIIVRDLKSEEY